MADPDVRPTRWGIIGTGGIAAAFLTDLALLPESEAVAVAVGSRTQASAAEFAARFGVPRAFGSYAELVADPDVDAVYVSTPHPMHHAAALLAIRAGKACLVEKPFTLNAAEARDLIDEATAYSTFLMEAMWTRFLPHVARVRDLISQGRIGDVRSFLADFGERFPEDPRHRSYDPGLGGGALLDLGIYPLSFASMLFGTPRTVTAVSDPAFTGVDSQTSVILQYDGGQHAVLFTSLEARTPNTASINGTLGRIEIEGDFLAPAAFRVISTDGSSERIDLPHAGRGLRHQASEVGRCLRAGLLQSPVMPLAETVSIMVAADEIRRQIGLVYPTELGDRSGAAYEDHASRPTLTA